MMQILRRAALQGNYVPAPPFRSFRPISRMTFKKGGGHTLHVIGCCDEISQAKRGQQIGAINRALDAPAHKDLASFADMCAELDVSFRRNDDFSGHASEVADGLRIGNSEQKA